MGIYEELAEQREQISYWMRRLYNKNLTTCSGGNISMRGPDDLVLITPAALDKGELRADQVAIIRLNGENLTPHIKPTIEATLHTGVLRRRPEMNAVVHAHPVYATAFACMDVEIDISMSSEIYILVDQITQAAFAPPGTAELADMTADAMAKANVALMRNHGVITTGKTMLKAFDLMEVTEATAKMNYIARTMGAFRPLSEQDKKVICAMYTRGG